MVVVLCVMALLLLLADTYIVLSVLGSVSWLLKGWLYLPVAVFVGLILWMAFTGDTRQMLLNGIMWITLCIVLPTLVFTVLSLVGRGLGLLWHAFSPIFTWGGLGICLIWMAVAVYGSVFGWRLCKFYRIPYLIYAGNIHSNTDFISGKNLLSYDIKLFLLHIQHIAGNVMWIIPEMIYAL